MQEQILIHRIIKAQKSGHDIKYILNMILEYRYPDRSTVSLPTAMSILGVVGYDCSFYRDKTGLWLSVTTEKVSEYDLKVAFRKLAGILNDAVESENFTYALFAILRSLPLLLRLERKLSDRVEIKWHQ